MIVMLNLEESFVRLPPHVRGRLGLMREAPAGAHAGEGI